jgi:hypothetical protein
MANSQNQPPQLSYRLVRCTAYALRVRRGFNALPLSAPGFDLPYAVQDFLPHIAFGLEFGSCLAGQLIVHEMTQTETSLAAVFYLARCVTDFNDLLSCLEETLSDWPCFCKDGLQFSIGRIPACNPQDLRWRSKLRDEIGHVAVLG